MQHRVSTGMFLVGCATLPFFNDFPYLSFITPSFLDLSFVFYVLASVFLIFESILWARPIQINKRALAILLILIILVFTSFVLNIKYSAEICGVEECGMDRMLKTAASDLLKFSLLVFFAFFIKASGIRRMAHFVRLGFYISFFYVVIEVFLSLIPYFLGAGRFELMDAIDSIFHARINDWGALRTRGFSFEPGYQGVFLIICLPFLFSDQDIRRRRRNLFFWVVCIATTFAPGAIVAGALFFLTYNFKSKFSTVAKLLVLVSFVPISLIVYLTMISGADLVSTTTRLGSWIASLDAIFANFFFGVGPGMSGYWVVDFYPDFFYLSPEAGQWQLSGVDFLNAPTFSSLLNFLLNYGFLSAVVIVVCFYRLRILENIFYSGIGRSAFYSLLVVSFTITSYQVMGYLLFAAISIVDGWRKLDEIRSC